MTMRLRAALRETLDGWQEDIASPWRDVITDVALGFEQVDATLELEPWEPIFPARRGRTLPGAPPGAHMLRAFDGIAPESVRCVIVGQDPYPCPAFATGRAFEAGNVARWRELDKMFSPSVRAVIQLVVAERTGAARYAESFARWPETLAAIEAGAVDLEAPEALAERWVASGALLLNSSLTLSRFRREGDPHQVKGHLPLWRPCWSGCSTGWRGRVRPSPSSASATRRPRRWLRRGLERLDRAQPGASSSARTPPRPTRCWRRRTRSRSATAACEPWVRSRWTGRRCPGHARHHERQHPGRARLSGGPAPRCRQIGAGTPPGPTLPDVSCMHPAPPAQPVELSNTLGSHRRRRV